MRPRVARHSLIGSARALAAVACLCLVGALALPAAVDGIPPGSPTGLTALPKGQTRIQLAWTAPEDEGSSPITHYRIEVSEDGGSSWNVVDKTRDARTDYRHGSLSAGDTRHYRVSAVSDAGESAPSNVASATTVSDGPAATNPNLPPPDDVTAAPKLPGQIRLSWWTPNLGDSIDSYRYRMRAGDAGDWSDWTRENRTRDAFHSVFVNDLDAGTTYEFQVRSVDKDDDYSAVATALGTATGRPTISIEGPSGTVTEGEPLRFTLSRGESHAHGRLHVILQISETGDMLPPEGRRSNGLWTKGVYFGDGNATIPVVLETVDDRGGPEPDSRVKVEVMPYPLHPGNPDNEPLYKVHRTRGSATKKVTALVPPTCTLNAGDLWCGVVGVGEGDNFYGYNDDSGLGYLSDTDLDIGTNAYTIRVINVAKQTVVEGAGNLAFYLLERPNPADQETLLGLTLHVDGARFDLSDTREGPAGQYYWVGAGLDWSRQSYVILRLREDSSAGSPSRAVGPLTAAFADLPSRHEGTAFTFRIEFSEDVAVSAAEMRDDALTVTGGTVTGAAQVDGRADRWSITVTPSGTEEVLISLPPGRDCSEAGAVCTADGRQLPTGLARIVAGPPVEPLTASFEGMPAEHDGERAFTFRIAFSEPLSLMNGRRLREDVVAVAGGRATAAGRVDRRRDLWQLTVEPDSPADVTVTLAAGAACGTPAAVCTKDGQALSETISATVAGPPASAPDQPTGLSATATHGSVTLTWDDPGDDSITGYVILRRIPGVDPEGEFSVLVADTGTAATTYTDDTVSAETRYTYRIKAINGAGTSERSRWFHIDTPAAPASKPAVADGPPGLAPNAPNPFNASTLIPYRLDADGPVRLEIYNLLGQPVRTLVNQYQDAGFYKVRWDARDRRGALVSAGMYLVRLHYPGGVQTQRLLYLK